MMIIMTRSCRIFHKISSSVSSLQTNLNTSSARHHFSSTLNDKETEIERKFECTETNLKLIKQFASGSQKIDMIDVYYDDPNYRLSSHDHWLRKRNNEYELKWPQTKGVKSNIDSYYESKSHQQIIRTIEENIYKNSGSYSMMDMAPWLKNRKLEAFGTFTSYRTRYSLILHSRKVFVDIDDVLYEPLPTDDQISDSQSRQYTIGEIELKDDSSGRNEKLTEAEKVAIMKDVMDTLQIKPKAVRGKVLEFLKRFRPQHYEILKSSGHLSSKGL
jgi:uncharacterized protein YjbK